MCKILVQSHACGHKSTLRKEICFLVKNKFLCVNEEEERKQSRYYCVSCRRQQKRVQHLEAVHLSGKREPIPCSQHNLQNSVVAKSAQQDPTTVIANLKALCAKVVAERVCEATPKPQEIHNHVPKAGILTSEAITIDISAQTPADDEIELPHPGRTDLSRATPGSAIQVSDFLGERNLHARTTNTNIKPLNPNVRRCQAEGIPSAISSPPWTQDHSIRGEHLARNGRSIGASHPRLLPLDRIFKHPHSPLSPRPSMGRDKERKPTLATTRAGTYIPSSGKPTRATKVLTTSARSARQRIDNMLNQEFLQTAHLGDVVIQSPEINPLQTKSSGGYDPNQSYLAFVKSSGYGQ
jgi:hypothetical protein